MQAEVALQAVTCVAVAVPIVAPASEPDPEVIGAGPGNKNLGGDGGWLTNLEAQAEGAQGANLGGLRTAWTDGHDCRGDRCEKNEALHGRVY